MRKHKTSRRLALLPSIFLALVGTPVLSQQNAQPQPPPALERTVPVKAESVTPESNDAALTKVLQRMDQTARTFRSLEANFVWKMYNSVVNDFAETDTGRIYFRRNGKDVEMAAEIIQPARKKVVFSGGKIQIAEPNGEIDVYDASAHREEFEAFLVLGFGSSSEEIRKSFDVEYASHEKIGSLETDKIELTPISQKIKERFPKIDLWIDPSGLSRRQQLFQADGDYRLADYSDFKLNRKISDGVFKLKRSANTKIINH